MLTPFQVRARVALAENPFFRNLPNECMGWLGRVSLRKGEALFGKDDASDGLYALVGGQLKLVSAASDRRDLAFGLVAPGELVGMVGIFCGGLQYTSAKALSQSELAQLARPDLDALLDRHPALRVALAVASAEATRRMAERIEDAAFLSIEARVEKALFDFARRFGRPMENGTLIPVRQQDLADLVGLSRKSVSRVLGSHALRDKVEIGRGRIVLRILPVPGHSHGVDLEQADCSLEPSVFYAGDRETARLSRAPRLRARGRAAEQLRLEAGSEFPDPPLRAPVEMLAAAERDRGVGADPFEDPEAQNS